MLFKKKRAVREGKGGLKKSESPHAIQMLDGTELLYGLNWNLDGLIDT